jgi:SAM-dependent methyltransferase
MIRRLVNRLVGRARRALGHLPEPPPPSAPAPVEAAPPAPPPVEVAPVPPEGLAEELRYLSENLPGFSGLLETQRLCLRAWNTPTLPCLPPRCYVDKDILELGCGLGAGCALYVACGARSVWGFDPTLHPDHLYHLRVLPRARFTSGVLTEQAVGDRRFDLIYAHFVTEHVGDLSSTFALIHRLLRPGGRFVGLHANYYGPLGGHDHAFIETRATERGVMMVSKAVPCWESPARCEASAEFRKTCEGRYEWTVKDWQLTPEDCSRCLYYQRAQVWSHLLYQDEYPRNYPGRSYRCAVDGGLNKATPFQVRQHLIETGFRVPVWVLDEAANDPPPILLRQFTPTDLKVSNILFAADRID